MPTPARPRAPQRRDFQKSDRRRGLVTRTLAVVLLVSLSVHLLFLVGFGNVQLFPGRAPSFSFTAQNLAEGTEEGPEGPPVEVDSTSEEPQAVPPPDLPVLEASPLVEEPLMLVENPSLPAPAAPSAAPVAPVAASTEIAVSRAAGAKARPAAGVSRSAPAFFGIPMERKEARVVLILDTSNTMFERKRDGQVYRFDFSVIQREAANLIDSLTEDSFFNLVIYESGSQAFAAQMALATEGAKKQGADWILSLDEDPGMTIAKRPGPEAHKLLEGRGTRLDTALKQTLGFQPTVVFILTDGEVSRVEEGIFRWLGELRKLKPATEVHVVQYLTEKTKDEETAILRKIATRGGGKFRTVEAKILGSGPVPGR